MFYFQLRPSRDLEKEEEITISYVDPLNSSADRQKLLQAKYNFTCQCKVCSLESQELAANDKLRYYSPLIRLLIVYIGILRPHTILPDS